MEEQFLLLNLKKQNYLKVLPLVREQTSTMKNVVGGLKKTIITLYGWSIQEKDWEKSMFNRWRIASLCCIKQSLDEIHDHFLDWNVALHFPTWVSQAQSESCVYSHLLSGMFKDCRKKAAFSRNEQKWACLVCEMVVGDMVLIPAAEEEIALSSQHDPVSFLQ